MIPSSDPPSPQVERLEYPAQFPVGVSRSRVDLQHSHGVIRSRTFHTNKRTFEHMESSRVCPLPLFSSGKDNYEDLQSRSLIHMDNKLNDLVHNLECLVSDKFQCRTLFETCTERRDQMMETHFKPALEPEHFRTIVLALCNARELICNLSNFRVLVVLRETVT